MTSTDSTQQPDAQWDDAAFERWLSHHVAFRRKEQLPDGMWRTWSHNMRLAYTNACDALDHHDWSEIDLLRNDDGSFDDDFDLTTFGTTVPNAKDRSGWVPQPPDILYALAEQPPASPSVLRRLDGQPLLYRGLLSSIGGPPESLKSWFAICASVQELCAGHSVIYLDFEDDPVSVMRRMLALEPDVVRRGLEDYRLAVIHPVRASGWFASGNKDRSLANYRSMWGTINLLQERGDLGLIVFDGVTSAMSLDGLDPNDNAQAVKWVNFAASICRKSGAAGLLVDHEPKDASNSRYTVGAGQKLAAITGTQFKVKLIGEAPSPGNPGAAKITVTKDRPGAVRSKSLHGHVGKLVIETVNKAAGRIAVYIEPPSASDFAADGTEKLRGIGAQILTYLSKFDTPRSTTEVKSGVKGTDKLVLMALSQLVGDGEVIETTRGNGRMYSVPPEIQIEDE